MTQKPIQRGYLDAFVDKLAAWSTSLGPERTSYTTQEVTIPLDNPEQIRLAATVYQPTAPGPATGTILVLTPYGRSAPLSLVCARLWAARGYNVLVCSVRGTFGSSGDFSPARDERSHGPLVVRWMRKQAWYTGAFATLGMSYLGYTQWALMASDEPLDDWAAAVVMVGPHDFSALVWGTGALWVSVVDWAQLVAAQEELPWWKYVYRMATAKVDGDIGTKRRLPLVEGVKASMGESPHYEWLHRFMVDEDRENDPTGTWTPTKQHKAFKRGGIPILLLGGWQDVFTDQTFHQYQELKANNCPVALTVGPWNHGDVMTGDGVNGEILNWLDKHLGKKPVDTRQQPVRIHVTGANEWRWLPSWPPATQPLELFLESQRRLSATRPVKTDEAQFTFDPHDPTPTMGGGLLLKGGYVNDAPLAKRADVLSFDLLVEQDIEVVGVPRIELLHSSDNPHVDVFVRLSEVNRKGVSRNLCEVYKRLDPTRAHQPGRAVKVGLDLAPVAHRFKRGTSIRLLVSGGSFPLWAFNLGSGDAQATGSNLRPATHTVHIGEEGSKLVLPVPLT